MKVALEFVPGAIANEKGDIYGTSPFRLLRFGSIVIDRAMAEGALAFGWRAKLKPAGCDDDFVWLERTEADRDAV